MAKINLAPAHMGGDSIALGVMIGKVVAIMPVARDKKATKFGPREMTQVAIIQSGAKEGLVGVMFQSYFQSLRLNEWTIGKVARVEQNGNETWLLTMEGVDAKAIDAIKKTIETAKIDIPGRESL